MAPPDTYPIQKAMTEAGVAPGPNLPSHTPDELMKRFGSLPLLHQPGEKWLMTQRLWESSSPPAVYLDFWTSAYQAIDD